MLPAVSTISAPLPAQPVFVATAIPGNNALRVPADNVPPTVANVQVSNNSRSGGNIVASAAPQASAPAAPSASFGGFIPSFNGTPTTLSLNAQTTFFTQLMSQDASPQTKIVLAQYEKLLQPAQVKYKPSNAGVPQAEPSSLFSRIVEQEKQVRVPVQRASEQAANSSSATQAVAGNAAPRPARPQKNAAPASANLAPVAKPRAISAYIATVSRNDASEKKSTEIESA